MWFRSSQVARCFLSAFSPRTAPSPVSALPPPPPALRLRYTASHTREDCLQLGSRRGQPQLNFGRLVCVPLGLRVASAVQLRKSDDTAVLRENACSVVSHIPFRNTSVFLELCATDTSIFGLLRRLEAVGVSSRLAIKTLSNNPTNTPHHVNRSRGWRSKSGR